MESMGKKPRRRRSFTPEFKAEIVGLCQQGDRSVGQVARDFDLTETAVREWVRQAERDAGTRSDGGLTSAEQRELARTAPGEPQAPRGCGDPQAGHGFLREGDPVNCYQFIEAEKAQQRSVKRACELLKVSRAAFYQHLAGPSPRARADADLTSQIRAVHTESRGRYGAPRACPPGPARARPDSRRGGGRPSASVRSYRARRAAQRAKALARGRLRAVAVDGETSRGARRADGTRVHLLGIAEQGGRLLDHLEVDVKHNQTSHFTELLGPVDLAGAVATYALHTVRANLDWLVTQKNAQYIAVVKHNQPLLHAQVRALPWPQVQAGSATRDTGHGRAETCTLKAAHVTGLDFPHARQAIKITRWRQRHRRPAEPPARPFTPSPA